MSTDDLLWYANLGNVVGLSISLASAFWLWRLTLRQEAGSDNSRLRRLAGRLQFSFAIIAAIATIALWRYSIAATKEADAKIAGAQSVADGARAQAGQALKDAGEANERAGKANERAAGLELKAAEANERALRSEERIAQLNLQIDKIQSPRSLQGKIVSAIIDNCSKFIDIKYSLGSAQGNQESLSFMFEINDALSAAGWKQIAWGGGGMSFAMGNLKPVGYITATGIVVGHSSNASDKTRAAAKSLSEIISGTGYLSSFEQIADKEFGGDLDSIIVAVGNKGY